MSHKPSAYISELKRVRGLGAAHEGTGHFWLQRMTALALIPLSIWFLYSLITTLMATDRNDVASWFQSPINAILTTILVSALFIHARLGIQVIIEDYVHHEGKKISMLVLNSAIQLILGLASIVAIAHLHFIGI